MTLFQILDEVNANVNEFQQKSMAKCHLYVVQQLFPEKQYRIDKKVTKGGYQPSNVAPNLIVNYG